MKSLILRFLGLEDIPSRVSDLEEDVQELTALESKLTDKLMDGRPQLRHTLNLLQEEKHSRKELVDELTEVFDISEPTAYRRINELEDELQFIEKTEKGYKAIVDTS